MTERLSPIRVTTLQDRKRSGQKITALTAYDATMARLMDRAGVDILLVGDSLGMVVMGQETTLGVTMDVMVHHARAVARGAEHAMVIADLPFLSYQISLEETIRNAGRLVQEAGVAAVKLEGAQFLDAVARLVGAGIPVMGHIGLTPQSVHQLGGYVQQGRNEADAQRLFEEARAIARSGAFALVLELIPAELAAAITHELSIPTIGIGAGPDCDGQILVSYDAFGLYPGFVPSFVKQYARLGETLESATREYIEEVQTGRFPARRKSAS